MIKGVAGYVDSAVLKVNGLRFIAAIAVLAVLFFLPKKGFSQGQAASASLSGEVHDSSGAVVRDATATVFSTATGIRRTFRTDAAGRYAFTQLPPGAYSLSVSQPGFSTYVQNGLALEIGQIATQDVTLAVGNINQEVVVTAEAPPLNTSN